jgi:hypothetical protein
MKNWNAQKIALAERLADGRRYASAVTVLALALLAGNAVAQQRTLTEQLVGTWAFVSSTNKLPDGGPAWGSNPKGLALLKSPRAWWERLRMPEQQAAADDAHTLDQGIADHGDLHDTGEDPA